MMESCVSWVSTVHAHLQDPWVSLNVVAAIVLASLLLVANYTNLNLAWFGQDPLAGRRQAHGHSPAPGACKDTTFAHQIEAMCQSSCRKKREESPLLSTCSKANTAPETPAALDAHALEFSPPTPPQEHHPGYHNHQGQLQQGCPSPHTPPAAAPVLKPPTPTTCTVHTQTSEELLQPLQSNMYAVGALIASHKEPGDTTTNPHKQRRGSSSSSSNSSSNCDRNSVAHAHPRGASAPAEHGWSHIHTPLFNLLSDEEGDASRASGSHCQERSKRNSSSSGSGSSISSRTGSPSPTAQGATQVWAHIHTPMFNVAPWDDDGSEGGATEQEDYASHPSPVTTPLLPKATSSASFRDASPCRPGYCYHDLSGGRSKGGRRSSSPFMNLDPSQSQDPPIPEQGPGGRAGDDAAGVWGTSSQRGRSQSTRQARTYVSQGQLPHKDSKGEAGGAADEEPQGPGEGHDGGVGVGCSQGGGHASVRGDGSNDGGLGCRRSSTRTLLKSPFSKSFSSAQHQQQQQQQQQLVRARSGGERGRAGREVAGREGSIGRQLFAEGGMALGEAAVMAASHGATRQLGVPDAGKRSSAAAAAAAMPAPATAAGAAAQSPAKPAGAAMPAPATVPGAAAQSPAKPAAAATPAPATAAGAAAQSPAKPAAAAPPGAAEGDGSSARALFSNEAQLLHEVQVWQQRAMEAERRARELQTEANSVLLQTGWLEEELAYRQEQEEASRVEATELQARLKRLETDHQQLLLQLSAQLGIQPSPFATPGAAPSPLPSSSPCTPLPLTLSPDCDNPQGISSGRERSDDDK